MCEVPPPHQTPNFQLRIKVKLKIFWEPVQKSYPYHIRLLFNLQPPPTPGRHNVTDTSQSSFVSHNETVTLHTWCFTVTFYYIIQHYSSNEEKASLYGLGLSVADPQRSEFRVQSALWYFLAAKIPPFDQYWGKNSNIFRSWDPESIHFWLILSQNLEKFLIHKAFFFRHYNPSVSNLSPPPHTEILSCVLYFDGSLTCIIQYSNTVIISKSSSMNVTCHVVRVNTKYQFTNNTHFRFLRGVRVFVEMPPPLLFLMREVRLTTTKDMSNVSRLRIIMVEKICSSPNEKLKGRRRHRLFK